MILSVPDHCLSFYFADVPKRRTVPIGSMSFRDYVIEFQDLT